MHQQLTRAVTLRYPGPAYRRPHDNSNPSYAPQVMSRTVDNTHYCGERPRNLPSAQPFGPCVTWNPDLHTEHQRSLNIGNPRGNDLTPAVVPPNTTGSADTMWGAENGYYPFPALLEPMTRSFTTLLDSNVYSEDDFFLQNSTHVLVPQEVAPGLSQPLLENDGYHHAINHAPDTREYQFSGDFSAMPSAAIPNLSNSGPVPDGGSHPPPPFFSPPTPASTSSLPSYPCHWTDGPRCGGWAPGTNREMGEHLRLAHHFVGHERQVVTCRWDGCELQMQRMNVARHIVTTHLRVVVRCRRCGRSFSRPDVASKHERRCDGTSKRTRA